MTDDARPDRGAGTGGMTEGRWLLSQLCRTIRKGHPRRWWAERYGLNGRAVQDLEQGRSLPSRSMLVLLAAIRRDRDFMIEAAKDAEPWLKLLEQERSSRN